MSKILDKIVEAFKWPLAVYMLLSLPACLSFSGVIPIVFAILWIRRLLPDLFSFSSAAR